MESKSNDLWVLVETTPGGKALNVGLELLNPGRGLAQKQGGALVAVVVGMGIEDAVQAAITHGAARVITVEGPEYKTYTTDAYTFALHHLVKKHKPKTLLIGATPNGRDLAPRLSCRLQTGLTADCTGLDIDAESGNVAWTRPAFGGNLMATILCPEHRPQMGTVRPGVFTKEKATAPYAANIIQENCPLPAHTIRTRLLQVVENTAAEQVDLEGATFIVAGGQGTGGPKGFSLLEQLAKALGATVASSRAAVEAGWAPYARQVGQTGKSVAPKVYIACGISGATQHLAGIANAGFVVAINKNPDAPIFNVADYGIVGDLFDVLPPLIEEISNYKRQAST